MKILDVLMRQARPRIWLGGARDMMQRAQSYYGTFGAFIGVATLYTVREATLRAYFPWINFLIVLGVMFVLGMIVLVIDYRIIYPSQIAFHQHEAWKHKSPVRRKMEENESNVDMRLSRIEKALGIAEEISGNTKLTREQILAAHMKQYARDYKQLSQYPHHSAQLLNVILKKQVANCLAMLGRNEGDNENSD